MMRKDIDSIKEIGWLFEMLTIEALFKKKNFYLEIFSLCDIHIVNSNDFIE
jgi:hypothetical protein